MNPLRRRIAILFLSALIPSCIFGGGNVPPTVGGSDDASGGNNGLEDASGPNNGSPDAGNNGTTDAANNGMLEPDMSPSDPDMNPDGGGDGGIEQLCGNGVVDPMETCDIAATGPDACPMFPQDCNPTACQQATVTGSLDCQSVCTLTDRTCGLTDGCCPANCSADVDEDCGAVCGNQMIEGAETCDGDCPVSCDDGIVCTADAVSGSAATCNITCTNNPINSCISGDGCCPGSCTSVTDNDCSSSCGDDVVDAGETCDGDCPAGPADCDDSDVCTADVYSGSPTNCNAACTNIAITTCKADGCCAPGCSANNDPDCAPRCGNGVVEAGEVCDGDCPASCDDSDVCTNDISTGSAATCDLVCSSTPKSCSNTSDGCCPMGLGCSSLTDADCAPFCGNGVVETGETCDGNCPTACNDNEACTTETLSGDPASCDVVCSYSSITICTNGDGCCPPGCDSSNDTDCSASCGNSVVEAGETCDGNCPTTTDCAAIDACHTLSGSAGQCNAECVSNPNCTACDRNGVCPCAAGQECNGGKCEASNGDGCTNACDESAFCAQWGGTGWVCDDGDDFCYECLLASHCETYEACTSRSCTVPNSCTGATNPDDWCAKFKGSGLVCVNGTCRQKCTAAADCPSPNDACVSGYCQLSTNCTDAKSPSAFCQNTNRGDYCSVGYGCLKSCAAPCDCSTIESCLSTFTVDKGQVSLCRLPAENQCALACDSKTYCGKVTGSGSAYCEDAPSSNDFCTGYARCSTKTECKWGLEGCASNLCVPATSCGVAKDPTHWCAVFKSKGTKCDTTFRGGACI